MCASFVLMPVECESEFSKSLGTWSAVKPSAGPNSSGTKAHSGHKERLRTFLQILPCFSAQEPAISSPDLTGAHLDIAVSKKVDLKASTGPKRQPQQMPCDPKHYTLDASFFTNQDDTQSSILQEITLKSTGVVLANQAEIAPWLQAGHHPKDELAVLLLQPLKPEDFPSYGMTMITCPRMRKATESCCESKW